MKVLDVSSLHEGIKGMRRQLSELENQLNGVETSIRSFVASKDSFRGKGASAIRRFYEYAHLPFLQFFQTFLANFQIKLQQLQYELDGLEGNPHGFIDEKFLTGELEDGLNQINRMIAELTGETNSQLSRVGDIVYLPRLQDHHFHKGIQQAKQSARQTVDKLHQFDHQQTHSFTGLVEDLSLINSYIEEMSQQFASGKINVKSFSPVMLQDLEAYGKLQTRLYNQTVMQRWNSQHYPELGVFYPVGHAASFDQWVIPSCAKPKPKKKSMGEVLWDFNVGFGEGVISAVSDTWDGIKRLATEPDQVVKETIEFIDAIASDPAILLEIGHELYNSFNESVIHGDANSRGEWLGYATTIIGTAVVGDKGVSRVGSTVGRLGSRVEADLNIKLKDQQAKALSSVPRSSTAGLERVRELMGDLYPNNQRGMAFAGVPSNAMNSFGIYDKVKEVKQNIITKIEEIDRKSKGSKEDYFVGTLKGEEIHLKGVKVEEIIYTKRLPEETAKLRKDFNNSIRKNFLKEFVSDPLKIEYLKNAGLSEPDIARMKDGLNPQGWQVHHNLPLDDGGTNDFTNLVLIKNDPYHKAVTNEQNSLTRGLVPKESKTINWPVFKTDIYPQKPFIRKED